MCGLLVSLCKGRCPYVRSQLWWRCAVAGAGLRRRAQGRELRPGKVRPSRRWCRALVKTQAPDSSPTLGMLPTPNQPWVQCQTCALLFAPTQCWLQCPTQCLLYIPRCCQTCGLYHKIGIGIGLPMVWLQHVILFVPNE